MISHMAGSAGGDVPDDGLRSLDVVGGYSLRVRREVSDVHAQRPSGSSRPRFLVLVAAPGGEDQGRPESVGALGPSVYRC